MQRLASSSASLVPRPPPFVFTRIHSWQRTGSSVFMYYCERKWKLKTGEAWEQSYIFVLTLCMFRMDSQHFSLHVVIFTLSAFFPSHLSLLPSSSLLPTLPFSFPLALLLSFSPIPPACDFASCPNNSQCISQGESNYRCECNDGYEKVDGKCRGTRITVILVVGINWRNTCSIVHMDR